MMTSIEEIYNGILESEGIQYDTVQKSYYKILIGDVRSTMNRSHMIAMLTAMASVIAKNTKTKSRKNELLEYYNNLK